MEKYTEEDLKKFKEERLNIKAKEKKEREKVIIERFNTMKPFKDENDIPEIPIVSEKTYQDVIIPNLIRCGAIPKKDLVVGKTYIGDTRNSSEATWDGEKFIYKRYKFGSWFDDEVNHFEDDDHCALFVPIKMKEDAEKR